MRLAIRRVAIVVAALGVGAWGDGTIDTSGATIAAGAAPTRGSVTIDPCVLGGTPPTLPTIDPLGSIGTMTGSLPAFPGGSTGADGAFHATIDQTLPGGSYDFTTYAVDMGATVTYDGPVTIRTTGDIDVTGTVRTTAASASITIRCGGTMTCSGVSGVVISGFRTFGATSDVDVAVSRDYVGRINGTLRAETGDVTLVVSGDAPGQGRITLDEGCVDAIVGTATLKAKSLHFTNDGNVICSSGGTVLQAFAGDVVFDAGGYVSNGAAAPIVVETSGAVVLDTGYINSPDSDITVSAFGGDVTLRNDAYVNTLGAGAIVVRTAGGMTLDEDSYVNARNGPITLTAFGGAIAIETASATQDSYVNSFAGDVSLAASLGITVAGEAYVNTGDANLSLRALGGDVAFGGKTYFHANRAVDVRASNAIRVTPAAATTSQIFVAGASMSLSSGAGGIAMDLSTGSTNTGPLTVLSLGPIDLAGAFSSADTLTVISCGGTVDVSGATITTTTSAATSADVVVETYAPQAQPIDAHGATIKSDDATATSGSVTLRVHVVPKDVPPPPPPGTIESFFLPKRVVMKTNPTDPTKSSLLAVGFFDTGPNAPDFTGAATLHVGTQSFAIPSFTPDRKGKVFTFRSGPTSLIVRLSPNRSSRAKFSLRHKGDLTGKVDPSGELDLRLTNGAVNADGIVKLTGGRYKIGRLRGALVAPNLYPIGLRSAIPGGGRDRLVLNVGLASDGTTPAAAEDVAVAFGDTFSATIPASSFTRKGDVYVSKGGVGGITSVRLDWARERMTIRGKDMDLGAFAQGEQPVTVSVRLGSDARTVRFRMVRRGNSIKY